jgi:hypothetical protein
MEGDSPMMTVVRDGTSRSLNWMFENDDRQYSLGFSTCENPFCTCREMTVLFSSQKERTEAAAGIRLNTERRTLVEMKKRSEAERFFERRFIAELSEADWKELDDALRSIKMKDTEEYDPSTGELPKFNTKGIERKSSLVPYVEIFPWASQLLFPVGETIYLLDDAYCVKPECACREVALAFIPFIGKNQIVRNVYSDILYNYRDRTSRKISAWNVDDPPLDILVGKMTAGISDLNDIVSKRHERLKIMYGRYRKLHHVGKNHAQSVSMDILKPDDFSPPFKNDFSPVGRNDPCPCGSGKKYKKCCGKEPGMTQGRLPSVGEQMKAIINKAKPDIGV